MSPTRDLRAVERRRLLDRMSEADAVPLMTVLAPAGFGKTTLLSQWADRFERSAYLRLTRNHDDPTELVADLASVLGRVTPVDEDAIRSTFGRGLEPGLAAAGRLVDDLARFDGRALLVLDDAHVVTDRRASDALGLLIEQLPPGLQVGVAGHDAPVLHLARMRAAGHVLGFDETDLAFDDAETRVLAGSMGVSMPDADVAVILAETGGWPVAVSLAIHSLAAAGERGDDPPGAIAMRSVNEYIRSELLDPLDADRRTWLLRSSVLETMSGPLCDAALEVPGSLERLRELEHSSLLIQRTDATRTVFRYHRLLRAVLRHELDAGSPHEAPAIAGRAARWYDRQGRILDALEFARLSGDRDLLAGLLVKYVWPLHWSGRIGTMERWVRTFDQAGVREHYPDVATVAGFVFTIDGRRHEAEYWLAAAEAAPGSRRMPDGSTQGSWIAMLRGMLLGRGVEALTDDAQIALAGMRPDSPFIPGVRLLMVVATWLSGRLDDALELAAEAGAIADARGAVPGFAMAAAIEASLALRTGQIRRARMVVERACRRVLAAGLSEYVLSAHLHAVAARVDVASGEADDARHHLASVQRLRPLMTASAPWLSVSVRLDAVEAYIALREIASARTLMREIDEILRVRPDLGTLTEDAQDMRPRLAAITEAGAAQWTLTGAELRVLQYLPTHLTFGEIAERLYVSPHTIKSQAVAIYSKLGVSSRRMAIEKAVEFGLLDGAALRFPLGPEAEPGIG